MLQPKTVFFDYGSAVTANWFAYAQRSGGDPTADRVGKFEFWFSNTDFAGVLPATPADAVVSLLPTDARVRDSVLRPYTLSGDRTGQYVALRLTVSALSANQPTNNIGGHEFRLMDGPGDVVLQVDRSNGAMTLMNNFADAQAIDNEVVQDRKPRRRPRPTSASTASAATPSISRPAMAAATAGKSAADRTPSGSWRAFSAAIDAPHRHRRSFTRHRATTSFHSLKIYIFTWTNSDGELTTPASCMSALRPITSAR